MSKRFTLGPWKTVDHDGFGVNVWNVAGNKCIAERCREPDARLIAAAPDMYEALKEMIDSFDPYNCRGDFFHHAAIIKAHAALAKADGTP